MKRILHSYGSLQYVDQSIYLMNIIDTWLKSFSVLSAPEKVGWVFVCIIMMLTLSPEIRFVFCKVITVIKFVTGWVVRHKNKKFK